MVKSWNEGIVKIDGVDFTVIEDVISAITGIPIMGKKFYRDRKIAGQAVVEFTKDQEEKKGVGEERNSLSSELYTYSMVLALEKMRKIGGNERDILNLLKDINLYGMY